MKMTEQMAIEVLKTDSCSGCLYGEDRPLTCKYGACRVSTANRMAIQALEEIRQYRAIGTVEEFKDLKKKAEPKKQGNTNDIGSHFRLSETGFLCCFATNKAIRYPLISLTDLEYCPCCGQHLDWE